MSLSAVLLLTARPLRPQAPHRAPAEELGQRWAGAVERSGESEGRPQTGLGTTSWWAARGEGQAGVRGGSPEEGLGMGLGREGVATRRGTFGGASVKNLDERNLIILMQERISVEGAGGTPANPSQTVKYCREIMCVCFTNNRNGPTVFAIASAG